MNFEVNDKVFDARYGWGVIQKINLSMCYPVLVYFYECYKTYSLEGEEIVGIHATPALKKHEYKLDELFEE